ncbi:MAG: response regulator [Candidatus Nanohaloarchaeota archaeon QJJ-9]|nr:response regulator [Candidatus Nanohaloarchaeota archaeon QJJ-9]
MPPSTEEIQLSVLLVDDQESFLEQEKLYLERFKGKYEIDTVQNPKKAVEKIENNKYEVIVSDYEMPEINGLDLLEEVKTDKNSPAFIMFTGKGREEVAMEALNLGADRYLKKGGDPQAQFNVLSEAIEQEGYHKILEEEIMLHTKRYEELFNEIPVAIARVGPDVKVKEVNPQFQELFGYKEEEILEKDLDDHIVPESRQETALKYTKKCLNGERINSKALRETKTGEKKEVELVGIPVEVGGLEEIHGIYKKV